MNCFYHVNESAVAQCVDCNKGLCNPCATKFSIFICPECNQNRAIIEKKKIITEMRYTFILGPLIGINFYPIAKMASESALEFTFLMFLGVYVYSGMIAGWYFLHKMKVSSNSLVVKLIFLMIKFIAAFYVGLVMLPIRTNKNIKRLKELKSIQ